GVPYPDSKDGPVAKATINLEEGRTFWSFQPVRKTAPPQTKNKTWPHRPIDGFILAELERRGLEPSTSADGRTMIRRLSFDLIGLRPTPEEVTRFEGEYSAKPQAAVEGLVERLLASPHYGERWGRYWLDLARYCDILEPWAETKGQPHLY